MSPATTLTLVNLSNLPDELMFYSHAYHVFGGFYWYARITRMLKASARISKFKIQTGNLFPQQAPGALTCNLSTLLHAGVRRFDGELDRRSTAGNVVIEDAIKTEEQS